MPRQPPLPLRLRALVAGIDQVPAAIALYDRRDELRWANRFYEAQFLRGVRLPVNFADVIRHGFAGGFGVKIDSGDVERFLEGVLMRRRAAPQRAFPTDLSDGTWLWMTETLLDDGWLVSIGTDVTALKREERVLRQARDTAMLDSLTDALTGLPNRRRITDELLLALGAAATASQPLSIGLLDLDHFKSINDRFGHEGGDEVLRQFASDASAAAPQGSRIGRLGGEEFLVVLPGATAQSAREWVERLRGQLRRVPIEGQPEVVYTFSAGIAQGTGVESPTALLRRADMALYRAKNGGRNRVEIADA